jgi:hypothetical protein
MLSIPPTKMVAILKVNFASQFLLGWSVALTKVSVAFMLLRIQRSMAWILSMSAAIFILLASMIVYTGFSLTQCHPISAYWDLVLNPSLALGCRDQSSVSTLTIATSGMYIAQVAVK